MAPTPASLLTSTGRLEDIQVPRDREGQFHTQAFERYSRYEPHIAQGLTEMFVAGTSTRHPWEKWPKRGSGVAGSRQHDQSPQPDPDATI